MIKIKITWPAAILILVAVLIWLSRPSAPAQPKPQPIEHPEPRRKYRETPADRWPRSAHANRSHKTEVEPVVIIDQRRDIPEGAPMTYEEALNDPTLTPEQVSAIGDAEALAAARESLENAPRRENPFFVRQPAWRKQS